jgi:hypothetical protein
VKWISVEDKMPEIGKKIILFSNGVVQEETYYLDAGDVDDYNMEYWWDRDGLDEGVKIKDSDYWMPLPPKPSAPGKGAGG